MATLCRLLTTCGRFVGRPLSRGHRTTPADDELYQRTTVNALERESQDTLFIDSYSQQGFTIGGNRVLGPCALIPRALLHWDVQSYKDISADSLAAFYLLEPKIEILVLGLGESVQRLDPEVRAFMKTKGIALEILDTPNACATFNFLLSERPHVAAALIPPKNIPTHQ
ncbi:NADH dehydrogenase [ubiquinone] 1 alpha subcomplex assembly factor 3 [Hemitrygon akajei]|uniref:NADH dehydrogenase [ubiquinone] 1 alpha subcomplex assembly factor 3 n=1 Tax=Hemitrygon akajei TaxID=2704970 RepID=UPI003BF97FB7